MCDGPLGILKMGVCGSPSYLLLQPGAEHLFGIEIENAIEKSNLNEKKQVNVEIRQMEE